MSKERSNNRGFVFENKIDLSQWEFNALDYDCDKAFDAFEEAIQNSIEKEKEKLTKKLGSAERKIRKVASEALQIVFEKNISAYFWEIYDKPELLRINFDDFSEDGYSVSIDLKKTIKETLLENCASDGYVHKDCEDMILRFADMLKDLENEIRTAIRPKED